MSANEIRVGDVGVTFQATVKDQSGTAVDISGATTKLFFLQAPTTADGSAGTITTISAAFIGGSGTSGVMGFTSTAGHFERMGKFKLQGYVATASTTFRTDIYEFSVSANLA